MAKFKYGNVVERTVTSTLSGDLVLAASDAQVQFLNPDNNDRSVILPDESTVNGVIFAIANISTDYIITVKDSNSNIITEVSRERFGAFVSNGTIYRTLAGGTLSTLYDVDFSELSANQILVYGYGNGYAEWTNLDAYDYFRVLGFADTHPRLLDMPDVYGYNEDHDVRYVAKVQPNEPTTPVPFPGMFWYDTDDDDNYLYSIVTVDGAYGVNQSNDYLMCNGTFTITLPAAADNMGKLLNIKNIGTGTITVDPNENETIDGDLTIAIDTQYECISIISDGSNWFII